MKKTRNDEKIARGLGWFSLALGLAEVIVPQPLHRWFTNKNCSELVRIYGARELTAGIGILSGRTKLAPWLWARVAGDALDLATLGTALSPKNPRRKKAFLAFAVVAGITALDVWCALQLSRRGR